MEGDNKGEERKEDADTKSEVRAVELTEEQKKRIESNRDKAKALRKKRIHQTPYDRPNSSESPTKHSPVKIVQPPRPAPSHVTPPTQWDTYGGYILDDDQPHHSYTGKTVEEDGELAGLTLSVYIYLMKYFCTAPPMPDERPTCEECAKKFAVSYLLSKFHLSVCDNCR